MTGVLAARIASPSLGEMEEGMPHPSMTTILRVSYDFLDKRGGNWTTGIFK